MTAWTRRSRPGSPRSSRVTHVTTTMATVEMSFTPLPAHVRTARLVATAVARRSGVDEALLDEVRLAVGEACSRAVEAHRRYCPAEPVRIEMTDQGERFVVVVSDHAPAGNATLHGATTGANGHGNATLVRSEEHTSELQPRT